MSKSEFDLTWIIPFPLSSRRLTLESLIGLELTSLASYLSLQNSLIASTFLQQHFMEVVTDKSFIYTRHTNHLHIYFLMITTVVQRIIFYTHKLLILLALYILFPMKLEIQRIIFYTNT